MLGLLMVRSLEEKLTLIIKLDTQAHTGTSQKIQTTEKSRTGERSTESTSMRQATLPRLPQWAAERLTPTTSWDASLDTAPPGPLVPLPGRA